MHHRSLCHLLILLFVTLIFLSSGVVAFEQTNSVTVTLNLTSGTSTPPPTPEYNSTLIINANPGVQQIGYVINGEENVTEIKFPYSEQKLFTLSLMGPIPANHTFTVRYVNGYLSGTIYTSSFKFDSRAGPSTISLYLELIDNTPDQPTQPEPNDPYVPGGSSGGRPDKPDGPDIPVIPVVPDNPPVEPENPGSDEPYRPILPPAGSVYNLAGFIPLAAGFLLLFLVFFWRRKVYRILNAHAKKHGEKPEKEHLKEIADAIIKLVRDEGRYPEWKKNSDVAKRLSADIVSVLDEMNYPKIVPRGALVAEILKAAKGRINRHRL